MQCCHIECVYYDFTHHKQDTLNDVRCLSKWGPTVHKPACQSLETHVFKNTQVNQLICLPTNALSHQTSSKTDHRVWFMPIYVSIYVCIYVHIYIYIYTHIHTYIYTHSYTHIYAWLSTWPCPRTRPR